MSSIIIIIIIEFQLFHLHYFVGNLLSSRFLLTDSVSSSLRVCYPSRSSQSKVRLGQHQFQGEMKKYVRYGTAFSNLSALYCVVVK